MHVEYFYDAALIEAQHLVGFHEGWPNAPTPEMHLRSLRATNANIFARDSESGDILGYVQGMTDGVMVLYVWDLEVRTSHRNLGIGSALVRQLLQRVGPVYQVTLHCDAHLVSFYERLGFDRSVVGMTKIDRSLQHGGAT